MNPPHLYCPELSAGIVTLRDDEGRHALRSLRLRDGDAVVLFDGQGSSAHGVLQDAKGDKAAPRSARGKATAVQVAVERVTSTPPPTASLTLIVAASKGARLEWMVEKCTELGVTRIILADFERSVVRAGSQHLRRLKRTVVEACKQCGRLWLPELQAGTPALDAIARVQPADLLVAHPAEGAIALGAWLAAREHTPKQLAVVIGPEGGFSAEELAAFERESGETVRLGPHVLRVETAAVAVAATWAARNTGS